MVPGFENYHVSDQGRIVSKINPGNHKYDSDYSREISLTPNKYGYVIVNLFGNGKKNIPRSVHGLVMEAFVGPRPDRMDIRHKNGIRDDNRLVNLEYGTRSENMSDAKKHGTLLIEERHHQTKISREDAVEIIQLCKSRAMPQWKIGDMYGITQQGVSDIFRGKCWYSLDEYRPERYRGRNNGTVR